MSEIDISRLLGRHLIRMRAVAVLFLASQPAAAAAAALLRPRQTPALGPLSVTGAAVGVSLWISFTADRHARRLLERVKRGYAAHGDVDRLLRHHLLVYTGVLTRLELVTAMAVATALWGVGLGVALAMLLVVLSLMALAWPTRRKSLLLVERARELRRNG